MRGQNGSSSESVSPSPYPLASDEGQSQNGSEANVNKHVFVEQKYVQYPTGSAPGCADMCHGGTRTQGQLRHGESSPK